MIRVLGWLLTLGVVVAVAGLAYVRFAPPPAPPDALTVVPPSSPNWAMAAPKEAKGRTAGIPTHETPVYAADPGDLAKALDAIAAAEPNTVAVPSSGEAGRAYVQRSALIAYPDLISAAVLDLGAGDAGRRASVVLYSKSVYGYSDMGVNAARIERWLAALDAEFDRVR